jgi:prohibitin 2
MASQRLAQGLSTAGVGLAGLAWLTYQSLFTVDAGHKAILYSKISGVKDTYVYSEGTHFRLPLLERPIVYDVRTHPRVINSLTGTRDL